LVRTALAAGVDNCYSDHAVVNARQLAALVTGEDPTDDAVGEGGAPRTTA
jgi:hypothetical protein